MRPVEDQSPRFPSSRAPGLGDAGTRRTANKVFFRHIAAGSSIGQRSLNLGKTGDTDVLAGTRIVGRLQRARLPAWRGTCIAAYACALILTEQ